MNPHGTKVLVVEDSRSINSLLCNSITSQLNIDVVSASSMEEAEQVLIQQADNFFVAILDLNLADAPDGEVVDCVLKYDLPSIILTGSMSDNLHGEMMEKPIIDYVVKRNINEIEYVIDLVGRLRDNQSTKALVVDDIKSSRMELSALLERHYFQVFTAADGVEALEVLAQHNDIQLIITDYNMPNMDGIEFTSKVRANYSRNELAIIGISASTADSTTIRFLKSGANDFITRPFLHEELYCRISQNIDAVRSFTRLRDAADQDSLTGLYNRKYLLDTGEKLFENAKRKHISLMTVMLDIDQFVQISADHGRKTGVLAIQHIAAKLNGLLRNTDVVVRYSGSEFCLLCVNADADHDEQQLLTNLRDVIQYSPLQATDTLSIPLTISMGYCTDAGESFEEMIDNAYAMLQKAKQQGHNQTAWHDPFAVEESAVS